MEVIYSVVRYAVIADTILLIIIMINIANIIFLHITVIGLVA